MKKMNRMKGVWVAVLCLAWLVSPARAVDDVPGREKGRAVREQEMGQATVQGQVNALVQDAVQAQDTVPAKDPPGPVQGPAPEPGESEWGLLKAPNLVDKMTNNPAGRHQGKAPDQADLKKQATKERRDPFSPTQKLSREKKIETAIKAGNPEFVPGAGPAKMPKLRLRGHLQDKDRKVVALLEIQGGGVYIVREGDTIGLHEFGYNSVIKIKKIDRLHLVVESGQLGRLIIVR